MNLKDVFRYQNRLQGLITEARMILGDESNVTVQEVTLLKRKVMAEAEDETRIQEAPSEYADRINDVVGFLLWLLSEHEKLTRAIRRTKNALKLDMDGEISLNKQRQEIGLHPAGDDRHPLLRAHRCRRRPGLPLQRRGQPGGLHLRPEKGDDHQL